MEPSQREYPDLIPWVQKLRPYIDTTCYPDYEGQRAIFEPEQVYFPEDFNDPPSPGVCLSAVACRGKLDAGEDLTTDESRILAQFDAMRAGKSHPYQGLTQSDWLPDASYLAWLRGESVSYR